MDPTRRRSGGALLGDRIRMNSLAAEAIFMRSLATRRQHLATAAVLKEVIQLYQAAGFDLVIVETAGTGQADSEIVDLVDVSLYVMTGEYGAASQLEKIDMLDYADLIVLNKSDKRGAEDSLRDVRKQWRRNHPAQARLPDADLPVFPTIASRFNDPGVNRLFAALCDRLAASGIGTASWQVRDPGPVDLEPARAADPRSADTLPGGDRAQRPRARVPRRRARQRRRAAPSACYQSLQALGDAALPAPLEPVMARPRSPIRRPMRRGGELRAAYNRALDEVGAEGVGALKAWPARVRAATAETYSYTVRDREVTGENYTETLSHQRVPKIAVPRFADWGELLRFIRTENLPGFYPYTGGVYPYRRAEEDPTRMFAGEGAAGAHQPPLPLSRAGRQRRPPVDRVRFDDALRRGSGHAAGHLRAHGQLRRIGGDAR